MALFSFFSTGQHLLPPPLPRPPQLPSTPHTHFASFRGFRLARVPFPPSIFPTSTPPPPSSAKATNKQTNSHNNSIGTHRTKPMLKHAKPPQKNATQKNKKNTVDARSIAQNEKALSICCTAQEKTCFPVLFPVVPRFPFLRFNFKFNLYLSHILCSKHHPTRPLQRHAGLTPQT